PNDKGSLHPRIPNSAHAARGAHRDCRRKADQVLGRRAAASYEGRPRRQQTSGGWCGEFHGARPIPALVELSIESTVSEVERHTETIGAQRLRSHFLDAFRRQLNGCADGSAVDHSRRDLVAPEPEVYRVDEQCTPRSGVDREVEGITPTGLVDVRG